MARDCSPVEVSTCSSSADALQYSRSSLLTRSLERKHREFLEVNITDRIGAGSPEVDALAESVAALFRAHGLELHQGQSRWSPSQRTAKARRGSAPNAFAARSSPASLKKQ